MSNMFSALFGGAKQEAPAQQPASQPNGVDPTNPANNPMPARTDSENGQSPLDGYSDLWHNAGNQDAAPAPVLNLNGEKLNQVAGTMDFTKSVTPENLQAIAQGGDAAMQAFAQVLNKVSQDTYVQSTQTTASLVEHAVAKAREEMLSSLPNLIKQQQVVDTVRQENPLVKDPAFAPVVAAVSQQVTRKYPNATAAEINQHVSSYFDMMGSKLSGAKQQASQPAETDWSNFFGN